MTLEKYAQYMERGEVFLSSEPGWYAVEVTDCDTIICGDYDGENERPFDSRADAERYLNPPRD